MKKVCVLFILKNDENFLLKNIEKIEKIKETMDLYFIVRESKDRTKELIRGNGLNLLEMAYDSGYSQALRLGFEYLKKYNYESVIEFGESTNIDLDEILKFYKIHLDNDKKIVFASRYIKKYNIHKRSFLTKIRCKPKLYIFFSIFSKVNDPYVKFRIYNNDCLRCIRTCFDYKINNANFIMLLYLQKKQYIEVGVEYFRKNKKNKKEIFVNKTNTYIYTVFITTFVKRFKIDKCIK